MENEKQKEERQKRRSKKGLESVKPFHWFKGIRPGSDLRPKEIQRQPAGQNNT
jgi:hypothetical protein